MEGEGTAGTALPTPRRSPAPPSQPRFGKPKPFVLPVPDPGWDLLGSPSVVTPGSGLDLQPTWPGGSGHV